MIRLFDFLENFDLDNIIKIYDYDNTILFEGKIGDVPQRINNGHIVIKESVVCKDNYLEVKVENDYE